MDLIALPLSEIALPVARAFPGEPENPAYGRPPIQDSDSLTGANLNSTQFVYEKKEDERQGGRGGNEQENRQDALSPFNTTFSAILDVAGREEPPSDGFKVNGSTNFNAKAIDVYETNARVIAGENNPLGGTLSLTL